MPGSQACDSPNCIAPLVKSKPGSSNALTASTIRVTNSDSQRAALGRALPQKSTRIAPATGIQISRLSSGQVLMQFPQLARASVQSPIPESAQQQDQSDDHRERIGVEITRLQLAHDLRAARHERGGAVDHHAIQHRAVAALPERATEFH